MKQKDVIDVVTELNGELCETNMALYENGIQFGYHTDGYSELVNFCGYTVYNSEDCDWEEIEVFGLKQYIINKTKEYIAMLNKIDFIVREDN